LNIPAETDTEKAEREKREKEFGLQPGGRTQIPDNAPYSVKPDEYRFKISNEPRFISLVDKVKAKFLEEDLRREREHKDKLHEVELIAEKKKIELMENQLNLQRKYLK